MYSGVVSLLHVLRSCLIAAPKYCLCVFSDLYDWSQKVNECRVTTVNPAKGLVTQKSSAGSTVDVNEELIALFRYDTSVFAVLERCPHAGK